jgi:hypothetical protein
MELEEILRDVDIVINVRKLRESQPRLSLLRVTPKTTPDLRSILVPWFIRGDQPVVHRPDVVDRARFPCFHMDLPKQGDRPLTIGEAADHEHIHPWYKPDSIRPNVEPRGRLPAYQVGDRLLLLDGNHRCISLVRFGIDYAVDLAVISGPIDGQIMADLAAFKKTSAT